MIDRCSEYRISDPIATLVNAHMGLCPVCIWKKEHNKLLEYSAFPTMTFQKTLYNSGYLSCFTKRGEAAIEINNCLVFLLRFTFYIRTIPDKSTPSHMRCRSQQTHYGLVYNTKYIRLTVCSCHFSFDQIIS